LHFVANKGHKTVFQATLIDSQNTSVGNTATAESGAERTSRIISSTLHGVDNPGATDTWETSFGFWDVAGKPPQCISKPHKTLHKNNLTFWGCVYTY